MIRSLREHDPAMLERLVDRAARELGMKPDAIRRKNFIPPKAMPYTTPIGDRTYHLRLNRICHRGRGWVLAKLEVLDAVAPG